jgi:peptide/nickel transport system substrate-binding protein
MGINNASPKLKDRRVRQALTYAINRKALVDGLLEGKGYVLNQHEPKASWAYNRDLENAYPYDVQKAKALLAEAGYKDVNGDGFVEDPQGKPYTLKLDYPTGNPIREDSAPIIAQDLRKAGINVQLANPREATSHYNNIQQGKVELYLAGWSLTPDPDPKGIWQSKDAFNYLHYDNPESDRLIREGVSSPEAFTQDGRKEIYHKWTALISTDAPQVFLYGQKQADVYSKRIQGITTDWRGIVIEDCIHWSIPKK